MMGKRPSQNLKRLAKALERQSPGAAASLREGLEETLTVQQLGLPVLLRSSLRTTNAIESLKGQVRYTSRRVRHVGSGEQALR